MKKMIFLVVDDCGGSRTILQGTVQDYCKDRMIECDILTAPNGKEAAEILNEAYVDVLLTDVIMPYMGGEELVRLLEIICPSVISIMMTGTEGYEVPEHLDVEGLLEKPISEEALYDALDRIVMLFFRDRTMEDSHENN